MHPRWFVQRDYLGVLGGVKYALQAGAELELPEQAAAMVNADQPGTLAPLDPSGRALDAPPSDRMKRAPGRKRAPGGQP